MTTEDPSRPLGMRTTETTETTKPQRPCPACDLMRLSLFEAVIGGAFMGWQFGLDSFKNALCAEHRAHYAVALIRVCVLFNESNESNAGEASS